MIISKEKKKEFAEKLVRANSEKDVEEILETIPEEDRLDFMFEMDDYITKHYLDNKKKSLYNK